jgi:hypothetical protein
VLVIDVLVMGTNPASLLKIATRDIVSDMIFSNDVQLRACDHGFACWVMNRLVLYDEEGATRMQQY